MRKPGQMLVIAVIFLAVVLILTASLFSRTAGFLRFGAKSIGQEQAIQMAEAGVDYAIWYMNKNAADPSPAPITVGSTGSFIVQIQGKNPPNPQLKTIVSTGYVPNNTSPRAKQTIKTDVTVNSTGISFFYAVQAGYNGVTMSNSAKITGVAGSPGNVYSNGNISAGVGTGQEITGDAFAVGTIDSPPITVGGVVEPGAPEVQMPTLNYDLWRTAAANGGITDCSNTPTLCNLNGSTHNIGPQKYINGNLTISNQAIVTVNGPVHVEGNLEVRNGNTQVNLNENFSSNGTVWIIDGTVSVGQGAAFNPTSANPKGYILVATTSTSPSAMSIGQSGANAVFYALEGGAVLSQTAKVNSLVANSLTMEQSATLTYDIGLADARFSSGPGGSWQIKKGTYRFTSSP